MLKKDKKRRKVLNCDMGIRRLMEHEGDPDIDEPYVPPVGNTVGGPVEGQASPAQPIVADTAEG